MVKDTLPILPKINNNIKEEKRLSPPPPARARASQVSSSFYCFADVLCKKQATSNAKSSGKMPYKQQNTDERSVLAAFRDTPRSRRSNRRLFASLALESTKFALGVEPLAQRVVTDAAQRGGVHFHAVATLDMPIDDTQLEVQRELGVPRGSSFVGWRWSATLFEPT